MNNSNGDIISLNENILARMDRLERWPLPPVSLLIIGLGYFFTFFDIADIGFAMPPIAVQFRLSHSEILFFALSIGLIGYIAGSYIIGTFADKYGRYKMLLLTMVVTGIGSFGDAVSTNMTELSFFRFITGLGVGADLNLVSVYLSEIAPPRIRGKITSFTFLIGIMGQTVTPFIALAIVPVFYSGWRILFGMGGIIAFIAVLLRFELPESPRWLILNGNTKKALNILEKMEEYIKSRGIKLKEPVSVKVNIESGKFPTQYVFKGIYVKRLALFTSMWFLWYIGNYGFLGDSATLLSFMHISLFTSIKYLSIGSAGYPIGAALMIYLSDRIERKYSIILATFIWFTAMLLFGTLAGAITIMTGSFLASLSLGIYLQVAYTYTAESYPTRARATGFALSDGIGHLGGAVGALLLPALVQRYSFFYGFVAIGVTGFLAGIIALFGPSSTGRELEKVSG